MIDIKRPVNIHQGYHAHVYFEDETLAFATDLCAQAGQRFDISPNLHSQQRHTHCPTNPL